MTMTETSRRVNERVASLPRRILVARFVAVFSRMEYALKATGFRLRNSKKAEADWDSFAKGLSDLRERNETRVKAAIQLFDTEPPRKQIVDGNSLGWKDVPLADGSNVELFLAVRRIRNNLFHGGKTPFIPRDKDLLDAGLALMTIALALHSGVRKKFLEQDAYGTL